MKTRKFRCLFVLAFALAATMFIRIADAQPVVVTGSNVTAYFGSQNDAFQASDPTGSSWPAVGTGSSPYNTLTALPGVPAPPGGIAGAYTANTFSPTASVSNFNDGFGNFAQSSIVGVAGTTQTVDDGIVNAAMFLNQTGTPTNYAYEQLNYEIDFLVSPGAILTGTTVTRSFSVVGSVDPTGFVDFGGSMKFWDVTSPTNAILMGTLQFFYFNNTGGPFSTIVSSSGLFGAIPAPDTLRVTGDFFLIGDPSRIQINSVPEPSSLALLGTGLAIAIGWTWRRRRSRQCA